MDNSYYVEHENPTLAGAGFEITISKAKKKNQHLAIAHLHPAIEILIIQNGRFEIEADGRQVVVKEGDIVLFRPNTIHKVVSKDDGETGYMVIKIKVEQFLNFAEKDKGILYLFQLTYSKDKFVWGHKEVENIGILPVVENLFYGFTHRIYASEISDKAYIILLLAALLRDEREKFPYEETVTVSALHQIYGAINIINSRFDENITAAECAKEVSMSYTYFSRRFKSVTGKSFTRYLNEVRINHAEKELLLTDKSVTEIAYSCGFNDVSYFISVYKKLRGKTPYKVRYTGNELHMP